MTVPEVVMFSVVFAVGVPSAWRNPTAAALVIAWIAGRVIYLVTGDIMPLAYYPFLDVFVIAVVMAKKEYRNQQPYRGFWHQLACILLERSPADRVILLIFAAQWCFYLAPLHQYYVWWSLWTLTIAQFLAAGLESFSIYRRDLGAASDTPADPGALLVAYESRGYG